MADYLKNESDISGSNWIELNISGTESSYNHWSEDSKYIDEFAYTFYIDIFKKNSDNFDYYGDTRSGIEQIIQVKRDSDNRNEDKIRQATCLFYNALSSHQHST